MKICIIFNQLIFFFIIISCLLAFGCCSNHNYTKASDWLHKIQFQYQNRDNPFVRIDKEIIVEEWLKEGKDIPHISKSLNNLFYQKNPSIDMALVAYSLGFLGDSKSIPLLIYSLKNGDDRLRIESAAALGHLKDKRAIKELCEKAIGDVDHNVRANCVVALEEIGDPRVLPCLQKALNDKDDFVSGLAKEAIDKIEENRPK